MKIRAQSNQNKHGIDFNQAQRLWTDSNRIEIPALTEDEQRFLVIGKIVEKHWTAVITYRDENVRIISVRRARDSEREIYEGSKI